MYFSFEMYIVYNCIFVGIIFWTLEEPIVYIYITYGLCMLPIKYAVYIITYFAFAFYKLIIFM